MSIPLSVSADGRPRRASAASILSDALLIGVACMFLLPFMYARHTMPIPSFYGEAIAAFAMLATALLAVCVVGSGPAGRAPRAVPRVALIFLPLMAVVGIQLASGRLSFAYNGLFPLAIMAAAVAATVLGATCMRLYGAERLLAWIAAALIAGGCWNVCAQLVQLTRHTREFAPFFCYTEGSLYGNLAQRNHLSTYLNWSVVATLYLFAKERLRPGAAIALLAAFMVGITLTASRMSWLQIAWTAGAGGYLLMRLDDAARPRHWRLIFGLPVALLAMTVLLPYVVGLLHLSFSQTAIDRLQQTEGLDHNRWLIYRQAWELFKAHPLLGIGPGELQFNQLLLMDHYNAVLFASSAHNLLLDLLVMTGVFGALGFAWFGIGWLRRIRKTPVSLEIIAILLILSALGIHALLEFPEWYCFFLFPAAFLMGMLETKFITFRANFAVRVLPLVAVLYGLVFCAALWLQYAKLEQLYYKHYMENPDAQVASPKVMRELYGFYEKSFFKGPAAFIVSWNLRLDPEALGQKLALAEKAIRYQPGWDVLYRYIILLGLDKKPETAKLYLVRLHASFPEEFDDIADKLIDAGKRYPRLFGGIAKESKRLKQASMRETTER